MRRYFSLTLQCNAPYLKTLIGNGVAAAIPGKMVNYHLAHPLLHNRQPIPGCYFHQFCIALGDYYHYYYFVCIGVCVCVWDVLWYWVIHIKDVVKLKMQKSITCTCKVGNPEENRRRIPYYIFIINKNVMGSSTKYIVYTK